ncbi:MAG: hypothetical protein M3Y28_04445 [Armatimonadota bacterium]|nr:hypothetical protein [Armatimonadota bacterium]
MLTGGEITAMACVLIVTGGLVSITGLIVHALAKVKIARIQRGLEDGACGQESGEGANDERKG